MRGAVRILTSYLSPRFVTALVTMLISSSIPVIPRRFPFALLLCLPGLASVACAQAVANSSAPASLKDDPKTATAPEVVELTPFTVTSTLDRGYQAQSTLGGSRLRTNLKDVAAPTTAFTAEFLNDVGITNTDDLARYMLSTEYDFGENAGPGQNFLASNSTRQLRMRGLSGGTVAVNFFKSDFPFPPTPIPATINLSLGARKPFPPNT